MTYAGTIESPLTSAFAHRPFVASYDLGYEYSQYRCIALRCMVEDAHNEPSFAHVSDLQEVASAAGSRLS
jgi:hypothetical protein